VKYFPIFSNPIRLPINRPGTFSILKDSYQSFQLQIESRGEKSLFVEFVCMVRKNLLMQFLVVLQIQYFRTKI